MGGIVAIIISQMQTDFSDASQRASLDCWAAILGRRAASSDRSSSQASAGQRALVTGRRRLHRLGGWCAYWLLRSGSQSYFRNS